MAEIARKTGPTPARGVDLTAQAVAGFLSALPAEFYDVRLLNQADPEAPAIVRKYPADKFATALGFLRGKNLEGFNIYARPMDLRFALVDDVSPENLRRPGIPPPRLVVETSPRNLQVWYDAGRTLEEEPARILCVTLCRLLRGDPQSARPYQIARLPGFTNRKPKHRQPNGRFPYVHVLEVRPEAVLPADFRLDPAILDDQESVPARTKSVENKEETDRSREDWHLATKLLRAELPPERVRERLLDQPKGQVRGADYVDLTLRRAREFVETGQYPAPTRSRKR